MLGSDESAIFRYAEGGDLHEALDPARDASLRKRQWRRDMDGFEPLRTHLAQDTGGVDHRIDTGQGRMPSLGRVHLRQIAGALVVMRRPCRWTHAAQYAPAMSTQRRCDVTAQKTVGADHQRGAYPNGVTCGMHRDKI